MYELRLPSLGADMEAGTLVHWRCKRGDFVQRGAVVAEVETDKGILEIECFVEGTIEQLLVEQHTKVPVGTVLALVREGKDKEAIQTPPEPVLVSPVVSQPEPAHLTPSARQLARELGVAPEHVHGTGRHGTITRTDVANAAPTVSVAPATTRISASPFARKKAEELGIALSNAKPTGPGGYVTADDVARAAQEAKKSVPSDESARMRKVIGAATARSKREIPHFYLSHTIDLVPALDRLRRENEQRSVEHRMLPAVLLLRAVVLAVRAVPELNAHWTGEQAPAIAPVHLGVAVSLRKGGLVAPAIMNAHECSLGELMTAFDSLVLRARAGQLKTSEFSAATITVTSLGERGVEQVFPVIVPPQVAMVGFGKPVERPFVVQGAVVPRTVVVATLAVDHRVTDGHRAGLFLAAIAKALEEPEKL